MPHEQATLFSTRRRAGQPVGAGSVSGRDVLLTGGRGFVVSKNQKPICKP